MGGARADCDRAESVKRETACAANTWPTANGLEGSLYEEIAVAATAGITVSFHSGHGDRVMKDCVPESASAINRNIMQ